MQIVVKVAPSSPPEAKKLLTDLVREALPEAEAERASVDPVFPDVKQGRRAGMLVVSLADRTSPETVAKVLEALRGSGDVEYAEPAAPRKGVAASRRRS
jgi:hypothetical protein